MEKLKSFTAKIAKQKKELEQLEKEHADLAKKHQE